MRYHLSGRLTILLCAAVSLAASAPADVDPAGWTPAKAAVYFGVIDFERTMERYRKHPGIVLTEDEQIRAAAPQFNLYHQLDEQLRGQLGKILEISPDNLRNPLGKAMGGYLMLPPDKDSPPIMVFMSGIADRALLDEYVGKIREKLRAVAADFQSVEFAGERIESYTARESSEDESTDDPNFMSAMGADPFDAIIGRIAKFDIEQLPSLAWTVTRDRLIVATDVESIRGALRVSGDSLAEQAQYREFERRFENPGTIRGFVNVPLISEFAMREMDDDGRRVARALGMHTCGPILFHVRVDENGLGNNGMFLGFQGAPVGLLKIAAMPNARLSPPGHVSAEDFIYAAANLEPSGLVDEIERIVRAIEPEAAEQFVATLGEVPTGEGSIHVRKDVIENLRAPFAFVAGISNPISIETARMSFQIGHRNAAALASVLRQFGPMIQDQDRGIEGQPLFGFAFPVNLLIGVGSNTLAIGPENAVEGVLRGRSGGEPLAESAAFRKMTEIIGDEGSMIMFTNVPRVIEAAARLAPQRDQIMAQAMFNPSAALIIGIIEGMGFSEMENPERFARRMSDAMTLQCVVFRTLPDGILIRAIERRPTD